MPASHTKEDAVLACVTRARPDEYTFVPGRVTVKFRIQRTGTVKGVPGRGAGHPAQGRAHPLHQGALLAGLRFPSIGLEPGHHVSVFALVSGGE